MEAASRFHMNYEPWWDAFQVVLWFAWFALMALALYFLQKESKKKNKESVSEVTFKLKADTAGMVQLIPDKPSKVKVWAGDKTTHFISVYLMAGIVPGKASY